MAYNEQIPSNSAATSAVLCSFLTAVTNKLSTSAWPTENSGYILKIGKKTNVGVEMLDSYLA